MKPAPFRYLSPATVEEASSVLAAHGGEAKILAGGQSLMPMLNFRLARPAALVDVNRIPSLAFVERDDGTLRIGALTRQAELEDSPDVGRAVPLVSKAMRLVGHRATRNRGTLGGAIAHADPAAELPAVLLALSAEVVAVSQARGERVVGTDDLFLGPFTTALEPDEILVEVRLPAQEAEAHSAVVEIARRKGDFALAGIAAAVALDGDGRFGPSRLAAFGVSPVPVRLRQAEEVLNGQRPDDDVLEAAAEQARLAIDPWDDLHGSAEYRRSVTGVLLRRVLVELSQSAPDGKRAKGG
jgi:carbon-monoxide dehydrogenase medium subunit